VIPRFYPRAAGPAVASGGWRCAAKSSRPSSFWDSESWVLADRRWGAPTEGAARAAPGLPDQEAPGRAAQLAAPAGQPRAVPVGRAGPPEQWAAPPAPAERAAAPGRPELAAATPAATAGAPGLVARRAARATRSVFIPAAAAVSPFAIRCRTEGSVRPGGRSPSVRHLPAGSVAFRVRARRPRHFAPRCQHHAVAA
jgi:hypothetical protein